MTDWATRASTPDQPLHEMQPSGLHVEPDETIAAIRRIIEEQEHLLPADILEAEARRQAEAEAMPAAAVEPGARGRIMAALRSLRG